jgi:hypothetical protein
MRVLVVAVGDGALGFRDAISEALPLPAVRGAGYKIAGTLDAPRNRRSPEAKKVLQGICNAEYEQPAL